MEWVVKHQATAALHKARRLGTHFIGGWVGPTFGLDRCRKFRPTGNFLYSLVSCLYFILTWFCLDYPAFWLYLQHSTQTSTPRTGFEHATPASDRPQTLALDRSAAGIGFDPRTVQPAASRYTDWAAPAPVDGYRCKKVVGSSNTLKIPLKIQSLFIIILQRSLETTRTDSDRGQNELFFNSTQW